MAVQQRGLQQHSGNSKMSKCYGQLQSGPCTWYKGTAPVAVVMISLNEAHNMEAVLENLRGWAQEVFLVDSFSSDETVDIALSYGVHVVQRRFRGFGDQWNFALRELPIATPWTMKLDPDERISDALKESISVLVRKTDVDAWSVRRRLWFMGQRLPVTQILVRGWKTGTCRFSDVLVNEYPFVKGSVVQADGELEHHDSPDLHHWVEKQNLYTTTEAIVAYDKSPLVDTPRLLGTSLQRRMWLKKNFRYLPFRFFFLFLYNWLVLGAWRAGWPGYAWARLRSDVMRLIEYKRREIEITKRLPVKRDYGLADQDVRVQQYD